LREQGTDQAGQQIPHAGTRHAGVTVIANGNGLFIFFNSLAD
jgi:hypothetical protein